MGVFCSFCPFYPLLEKSNIDIYIPIRSESLFAKTRQNGQNRQNDPLDLREHLCPSAKTRQNQGQKIQSTTEQEPIMALPELTDEERRAALDKAARNRSTRAAYKKLMKAGAVTAAQALDEPIMQRARVVDWLAALPGIGRSKAARIMDEVGISPSRRVQGLGVRQREELLDMFRED